MILTDGTTTFTATGTYTDMFSEIIKSTKTTAGGHLKSRTTGQRFIATEQIRITEAEWGTLSALITNNAETYYYTPPYIPEFMNSIDFPISVDVSVPKKRKQVGGGGIKYYLQMKFSGNELI